MSDRTISGSVTQTVTLGSSNYATSLSITTTGVIRGSSPGDSGVVADTIGVALNNAGNIYGGDAAMTIVTGYIIGPADRKIYTYRNIDYSGAGDGVSLSGAQFNNFGNISGGTGPSAENYGAGIYLAASTGSNSGLIQGGATWGKQIGYTISTNGNAAPGAALVGGYFHNRGTIVGGYGLSGAGPNPNNNIGSQGGQGGDGVTLTGAAVLENTGVIEGGQGGVGGNGGTFFAPESPYSNTFSGGTGGVGGSGIYVDGGTLINSGLITGGNGGVGGAGNGQAQGLAGRAGTGVIIQTGLLVNAGTISGSTDAVSLTGTGTLQVDAGAVFDGIVQANAVAGDDLVLSGNAGGTIWVGQKFLDFSTLDLSQGTSWTVEGNLADLQTLTITGLSNTDTLELYGVATATSNYVMGVGLEVDSGTTTSILPVVDGLNGAAFTVAPCFCLGTRIRTPRGEVPIETLSIGDEVETAFAGTQHIKWIGHRSYDGRFISGNHLALPICIKKNAIDDNVPSRDLWVSPDHAIAEAGVLIHAWRLVNGKTIIQAQQVKQVHYIHIELRGHHIVFAENCATETFRDTNCRSRFDNAKNHGTPYGVMEPPSPCLPLVEGGFHLQNIRSILAARAGISITKRIPGPLRGNLDEVAPTLLRGWAQDMTAPEEPVMLDIFVNGQIISKVLANYYRADLRRAGLGSGCHAFQVKSPPLIGSIAVRRSSDGARLGEHLSHVA